MTRTPLRVASYNVRYAGLDAGRLDWSVRRDGVASLVRDIDPDVLAVQEVWMDQLPDLRDRLPGYDWVAFPDRNGEHTPIAVRRRRVAVASAGAFGLAPGGDREVTAWDAAIPRTVTHATLRDRRAPAPPDADGRTVAVFSVHLDHAGERARLEGARLVRDRVPDGPVVVAGDLNCQTGSPPYEALTADLTDARLAAHERDGPDRTYVGFDADDGVSGDPAARRIDHVLVRGCAVERYRVVPHDADAPASDHFPVVADVIP